MLQAKVHPLGDLSGTMPKPIRNMERAHFHIYGQIQYAAVQLRLLFRGRIEDDRSGIDPGH